MHGETLGVPSSCLGDGEVSSSGPDPISVSDSDPVPVPSPDPVPDPVPVPDPDSVHVPASGLIPSDSVHQVQYEASVHSPPLTRNLHLHHSVKQSLAAFLHPSAYPKQESFKDVAASLPHDPDNPFHHDSLATAVDSSGPSDPSFPVSTNRRVPSDSTYLLDLLSSLEDVSCPVPSVRMVPPGSLEFLHPSLPELQFL